MAIPLAQELNQKITFQTVSPPFSVLGTGSSATTAYTAWARITERDGSMAEAESQQGRFTKQGFEIWTRYISGVTGFMEILWGTRRLVMTGPPQKVVDSRGQQWWLISAEETKEES